MEGLQVRRALPGAPPNHPQPQLGEDVWQSTREGPFYTGMLPYS